VPDDLVQQAEANIALPIGHGQTISQPATVAFMFELLDPKRGQNILDVGSGSGWTTGLLAYIAGEHGKVTGLEIIKELCEFGKSNVEKFSFVKKGIVEFHNVSGFDGFEKNAPYDRILISASVEEIPSALKKQLAIGGKMVLPVFNDVWYVEKKAEDDFAIEKFPGFSFVPFVEKMRS
jgi:protein-L-isoaspartate(D-aspartate) O-methyltransferase